MKKFTNNGINGNEISLEDVLEMANQVTEQIAQKEEDNMKQFERIVKGVSRKYASIYVDREDLEQELWLVVCTKIQEFGGADKLDPRFIAKCCYNRAVDYYRYCRRRRDSSAQLIEEIESDDENPANSETTFAQSTFDNGYDRIVLKEVIDLFPQGSRERKYVVTKLYMYGEISEADGLPDKLEMPAGDTEADVLKLLGYNSRYPASWGKLKYQIRDTIYRHLGILPESSEANEASVKATMLSRIEELTLTSRKGYIDFKRILRDRALILLGLDEATLRSLIDESDKILKSVGPNGDWWALKNDAGIAQRSFIEYGYKVFYK